MGVFDYVDFEMPCPVCKAPLTNFQTKDGDVYMNTVDAFSVYEFGAWCDKCESEIDFFIKKAHPEKPVIKRTLNEVLDKYDMRVRTKKERDEYYRAYDEARAKAKEKHEQV